MRYKRLIISVELFFGLFTQGFHPERGYAVIADPIPPDAKLVHVRHAWPNQIEILISSDTFPELKKGQEIPQITPTLRSEQ